MAKKCLMLLLVTMWLSQAQSQAGSEGTPGKANQKTPQVVNNRKEKAKEMTNQEAWKLYERYLEGWKAISAEQRATITAEVVARDARYSTPKHESGGRETMIEDMAAFQEKFPGGRFDLGDVTAHHDVALLTWVLVQADGTVLIKGHDQIRISPAGKIVDLITFAPSVSQP